MSIHTISFVVATARSVCIKYLPAWALLVFALQACADPPKVVVSILPVHSLVSAVIGEVGDAQLLLPAGQSPHTTQLKPSQVRALDVADLIIWIGPTLERPLEKTIARQGGVTRIVTLIEHHEITLLSGREGGEWQQPENGSSLSDQANGLDAFRVDPHLWLSVANAQAIVRIVTRELVQLDPINKGLYTSNSLALLLRLGQLRDALWEQLYPVSKSPYVVFHDAYRYFEREYKLQPVASLTVSPDRPPGARRIREIKQLIRSRKIQCIFSEPQFQPGLVQILVDDTDVKSGILDPLGAALQPGPGAWFTLMQGIADALVGCLHN